MRRLVSLILMVIMCLSAAVAEGEFYDKFPGKFLPEGSEPIITETSYQSDSIYFTISSMRVHDSDVYVIDIYIASVENLQRYYGGGDWRKKTIRMSKLSEESGCVIAMTGDSSQNFSAGWVIGNGEIKRGDRNRKRDLCILYRNGEMVGLQPAKIDNEAIAASSDTIWQTFLFGPTLLDENGVAYDDFSSSNVQRINPRSVIGYYEPGHYCFVQVDGRGKKSALEPGKKNRGLTLEELAVFMQELGCAVAYNLDGGRSSMVWNQGEIISTPAAADRQIGDIVLLKELD